MPRPKLHPKELVEEARAEVLRLIPEAEGEVGTCLVESFSLVKLLWKRGYKNAVIQAGDMSWLRLAEDDGVSPTHFSYWWDDSPSNDLHWHMRKLGLMPEIHVWAALLPTCGGPAVLIDPSTRNFPKFCERAGEVWTAPHPPDFLWTPTTSLPKACLYQPKEPAIRFAFVKATELFKHLRSKP